MVSGGWGSVPRLDPFELALAQTSREFQMVARQVVGSISARDNLSQAMSAISAPGLTLDERAARLIDLGLSASGIDDVKKQITGGTITFASLQSQANSIATGLQTDYDRLVALDPITTFDLFPQAAADSSRLKFARTLLGDSGDGGRAQQVSYSFQIGPRGEVIRMGSNGAFDIVGTHPELASKNVQVQTNAMTGEAFALTLDADGNVVNRKSLGQVAFPEIDPEQKFKFDILSAAASVEQSLAGIEIQRRGQVVQAIGTDFSNQVLIGSMVEQEARLNLDRIDTAMTQERAERQLILRQGVTHASLRTNAAGETVTRLPFADQWASILSAATGRTFSPSDFELGTTVVNPEQTARDVLSSSAFTSPIPGLVAGLQSTRAAIDAVVGQPLGDMAVSKQITEMAIPGVK